MSNVIRKHKKTTINFQEDGDLKICTSKSWKICWNFWLAHWIHRRFCWRQKFRLQKTHLRKINFFRLLTPQYLHVQRIYQTLPIWQWGMLLLHLFKGKFKIYYHRFRTRFHNLHCNLSSHKKLLYVIMK